MSKFKWEDLVDDNGVNVSYNKDGDIILNFTATTTSSTGVSTVQPTIILKDILAAAQEKSYFIDAFEQSDAGIATGQQTIKMPIATSNLTMTEYTTEASARTMTEVTNVTAISFAYALKKYGVSVAKNVVHTSATDYLKFAREQLIFSVATKIDQACAAALAGATPAATLYGGDAASIGTLATGDVLTTDLVANAKKELRKKSYIPEANKPFILFIAPEQEAALLKDSQFVNASEYGSNEVVMTGEIGKYIGIKVVVSTNTTAKTTGDGWGANGHECYLVKAKDCGALVWFEKPSLDGEYKKDEAMTNIYLDTAYAIDTLQDNAIVFIRVTDA